MVFVPGKLFQSSPTFVGKTRGLPKNLRGISLGKAQALLTNIRLGWKGLSGTNTLA
jgi:hypothetical protein